MVRTVSVYDGECGLGHRIKAATKLARLQSLRQRVHVAAVHQAATAAADHAAASNGTDTETDMCWFYLDSVGKEFGPISSNLMRKWLVEGRFPVRGELRIRLPDWKWHIPLCMVYKNIDCAFATWPAHLKPCASQEV